MTVRVGILCKRQLWIGNRRFRNVNVLQGDLGLKLDFRPQEDPKKRITVEPIIKSGSTSCYINRGHGRTEL